MVRLYWYRGRDHKLRNFGDLILPYIYVASTGRKAECCERRETREPVVFGAGSILAIAGQFRHSIVWGSGIMHRDERLRKPGRIVSVRGPLSRARCLELGIACPERYGDIGLLLPRFFRPDGIEPKYRVGVIPHYNDYSACCQRYRRIEGILVIDVMRGVEPVVRDILSCQVTVSSSLHGVIVSHAYDIRSCWVEFSDEVSGGGTKFRDYYASLRINEVEAIDLRSSIDDRKGAGGEDTVSGLEQLVSEAPNPEFPIDTDSIMRLCPW